MSLSTAKNLLVLYNPYYNGEVIEEHLSLLKKNSIVAFGKVRSALRNYEHPNQKELDSIYEEASKESPLQLFLTDYNSVYVANVISIQKEIRLIKVPKYYDELEVEYWFVFDDLRLIVHNDFELIRDKVLANFTAINFNNRTYTIYGNPYVYPMQVSMKKEINYFEKDELNFKFFTDIFKSKEQLEMKQNLIEYNFGHHSFYTLAPNSQDNIISAEIEYAQNKMNPLYDFSSVVMKYSKVVELELYGFMKEVFSLAMDKDENNINLNYSVQGKEYLLKDILEHRPNFGTYTYLIKNYNIKQTLNKEIKNSSLRYFIFSQIPSFIRVMQSVRNEAVHGNSTTFKECNRIRAEVVGIGQTGFLVEFHSNMKILRDMKSC